MTGFRMIPFSLIVWITISSAGCETFLPQRSAPPEGEMPDQFSLSTGGVQENNHWWEDFESENLNTLIEDALEGNLTIRQLWARLDQAGSIAKQAASDLYPELTAGADAGYRRTVTTIDGESSKSLKSQLGDALAGGITQGISNAVGNVVSGDGTSDGTSSGRNTSTSGNLSGSGSSSSRVTRETEQYGLSLAANYEVDIWGRIRSGYRSAELDVQATRSDLEASLITLAAEVTDRWLRILEQQELQRILADQLETNQTYLGLVELRFRKNRVSALDVYQQRQIVSGIQRLIPLVQMQEQVLRNDLAVLLGRPPASSLQIGDYDLSDMPPPPSTGIPADLLLRRPDVRAAFSRVHAADYRVAAARADRLPAIRLTGGIGYSADDIDNLFDDWFVNLAGGLTAPLFDGFRREAEVERTLAVVEERLAAYRLVVLTAIREVEDALVRELKQRDHIQALTVELEAASNAFREASRRYQKGLSDYLPVLTALERTQLLTRYLVIARRELLLFRVSLYRALGGTWTHERVAPSRPIEKEVSTKAVEQENAIGSSG